MYEKRDRSTQPHLFIFFPKPWLRPQVTSRRVSVRRPRDFTAKAAHSGR